jgi:hypothetical protein
MARLTRSPRTWLPWRYREALARWLSSDFLDAFALGAETMHKARVVPLEARMDALDRQMAGLLELLTGHGAAAQQPAPRSRPLHAVGGNRP